MYVLNLRKLGTLAICASLAASCAFALDDARIDEIAQWLPEKPAATGARIGDRAAWDRLAALPSAASRIKAAEKALAEPIPDVPDELYLEFSRNGNRTNYQNALSRRNAPLGRLVMAECYENKGRFIPRIEEHLRVIFQLADAE